MRALILDPISSVGPARAVGSSHKQKETIHTNQDKHTLKSLHSHEQLFTSLKQLQHPNEPIRTLIKDQATS